MVDARIEASQIEVDTNGDTKTVTLKGTVPTAAQRAAAEKLAREKAEGYTVRNLLTVAKKYKQEVIRTSLQSLVRNEQERSQMKTFFAASLIVLAGLAYLVGYWPEHQRRRALEGQVATLQLQLAEAQARVRLGDLLGQLLAAKDAVSAQNYGQAQALSSKFFDAVRAESPRTATGTFKDALDKVVPMRDPVTASLTRAATRRPLTLLQDAESQVRNALWFPRPTTP